MAEPLAAPSLLPAPSGPPAASWFQGLVTALINELAGEPDAGEVLLVLDDYHVISSRPVHESLAFLLEHRPPGICVVLASRSDPPLPLARLRARPADRGLRGGAAVHLRRSRRAAAARGHRTGPGSA